MKRKCVGHDEHTYERARIGFKKRERTHTLCSWFAYDSCIACMHKYVSCVIGETEIKQNFVSECVAFGRKNTCREKFKALQYCHSQGLPLHSSIFEFEQNFLHEEIIWLIEHGTRDFEGMLFKVIRAENWNVILNNQFPKSKIIQSIQCIYNIFQDIQFPSSLIALLLCYTSDNFYLE